MKVFKLPKEYKALIFDMDLTLYSDNGYGQYQTDCMVEKLGKIRGLSFDAMCREVEEKTKALERENGIKPSLANVLTSYGLPIEEIIRWREELIEPGNYLKIDPKLCKTLEELSHFFSLGVVTNNPVSVARKTFAALGVGSFFPVVVGIDVSMVSKPHRKPFEIFTKLSGCPPESCVSIGDRYDIDLAIPLEMGMGAVLVDGVEDVYGLPEILISGL